MSKAIHRVDQDGYTECGRLVEGTDLLTQPVDGSGDPATCGTCLRQLRDFCRSCDETVICVRVEKYDSWADARTYNGQPGSKYRRWLNCTKCDRTMTTRLPQRPGHHAYRLSEKRRLQDARDYRDAVGRNHRERAEQLRLQQEAERAEHQHPVFGCAVCGEPNPMPGMRLRVEWHKSPFPFLEWIWCPDHAELGRETDRTLLATFRNAAADIRAGLLARI